MIFQFDLELNGRRGVDVTGWWSRDPPTLIADLNPALPFNNNINNSVHSRLHRQYIVMFDKR